MPDRPTVVARASTHTLASWRGHALAVWRGSPGVDAIEHLGHLLDGCARANPGRAAYLAIVVPPAALPSPMLREGLTMLTRRFSGQLACAALAMPGSGVNGAAVRNVIDGLRVMVRPKYPLHCFETIAEMAAWSRDLIERAGGTLGDTADLEAAFAELRGIA